MPPWIYYSREYVSSLIYKYLLAASADKKHPSKLPSRPGWRTAKGTFRKNSRKRGPGKNHDFTCSYTDLRGQTSVLFGYWSHKTPALK